MGSGSAPRKAGTMPAMSPTATETTTAMIRMGSEMLAGINAALMPASISLPILIIAVVVSVAVGLMAGIVPAFRGAEPEPIEALPPQETAPRSDPSAPGWGG